MLKSYSQTCSLVREAPIYVHNCWVHSESSGHWRGVQMSSCYLVTHLTFRLCFQEPADGTGDIYMSADKRET